MKKISLIVDGKHLFDIHISKKDKIIDIKETLKKYQGYDVRMNINPENELKVFDTEKYDKMNLESVWDDIESGVIFLTSPKQGLTMNKDVDKMILMKMDDRELFQACKVNKYIYGLCKDEFFWRERYNRKFPNKKIDKPANMTFKEYYIESIKENIGWNLYRTENYANWRDEFYIAKEKRNDNDILSATNIKIPKKATLSVYGYYNNSTGELITPLFESQNKLNNFVKTEEYPRGYVKMLKLLQLPMSAYAHAVDFGGKSLPQIPDRY